MEELEIELEKAVNWLSRGEAPVLIAGPCSAESEEQVVSTARSLIKNRGVDLFRAGVWKPRTRPNSFEGVGEIALDWLKTVKKETGLKTTIEVANAKHVHLALKAGVDVLWIGARTTVNPFSVQEIADALKGVDVPVMVKNPINPDLNLWIGAIERFNRAGIKKIAAIHRGFATYDKQYRNSPNWDIPINLKTALPGIPIICDPSHITGRRNGLKEVAQKALDLDMDGLMIEVHPNPDKALSDSGQQVTPNTFFEILDKLKVRVSKIDSSEFVSTLESVREEIDQIDAQLIRMLAKRMDLVKLIGGYKKENRITILQLDRWKEILDSRLHYALSNGLDEEFVVELLNHIHKESIKVQNSILNESEKP